MNANEIAAVCHAANRALQLTNDTQVVSPEWSALDDETKRSAVDGVMTVLDNPEIDAEDLWVNWCEFKETNGWKYGPVKDTEKKEHPNLIDDYRDLPEEEREKYELFVAIVNALKS